MKYILSNAQILMTPNDNRIDLLGEIIDEYHVDGVVEVILITVVLIALVIIFKKQISGLVSSILSKMSNQANQV